MHDQNSSIRTKSQHLLLHYLEDQWWECPRGLTSCFESNQREMLVRLKNFRSYLSLILDKDVVAELTTLIEEPQEEVRPDRRVNHVGKRLKIGRELRMTA